RSESKATLALNFPFWRSESSNYFTSPLDIDLTLFLDLDFENLHCPLVKPKS
ncbi:24556_t:CDS:2, partial [Dentiscutata erythropus]